MTALSLKERCALLTPIDWVLCLLGFLSLGFSFYATSVGFNNTIFDFHGFRQAQTAISAESMLHGGSFFRYETPVFGPPWSLPFEFPLYQGIVAGIAKAFSTPLDQTGRFVSIVFYYLCFFPLASILSRLGLRGTRMVPCLALFAVSPIYVFVSRLFMIESTALFFSLMYADQMLRLTINERPWKRRYVAGAMLFGVVAGLVKVTTLAPFFVLGSGLVAWRLRRDMKQSTGKIGTAITAVLLCLATPVAATLSWTRFADHVKARNPIGIYLISSVLNSWTFGPFAQRLHPRLYIQLLQAADNHIGSVLMGAITLATYFWLRRRWNWIAVACLALYIGTILLFFNLHVVHEYYPYSNAIFLVVAAGALITAVIEIPGPAAWIGIVLLFLQVGACGMRYLTHYYALQQLNAPGRPDASALVGKTTPPGSVVLIVGLEWSAEFPYQSHRRAIMDAFYPKTRDWSIHPVEQAILNQGKDNIVALLACDQGRKGPRLSTLLRDINMSESTTLHADDCDIYERRVSQGKPQ